IARVLQFCIVLLHISIHWSVITHCQSLYCMLLSCFTRYSLLTAIYSYLKKYFLPPKHAMLFFHIHAVLLSRYVICTPKSPEPRNFLVDTSDGEDVTQISNARILNLC